MVMPWIQIDKQKQRGEPVKIIGRDSSLMLTHGTFNYM